MTNKVGLNEDEYLALVERIQKAMCIEPFRPDVADVVVLIGTVQTLNREITRLRARIIMLLRCHYDEHEHHGSPTCFDIQSPTDEWETAALFHVRWTA